jgi:hypothetical protein
MAKERSTARDRHGLDLYNAGRLQWTAAGKISTSCVRQLDIGSRYLCQIAAGPYEWKSLPVSKAIYPGVVQSGLRAKSADGSKVLTSNGSNTAPAQPG